MTLCTDLKKNPATHKVCKIACKTLMKSAVFGHSYCFFEFAISFSNFELVLQQILVASRGSPCKTDKGILPTPPLHHLQLLWPPCVFWQRFKGMVWYHKRIIFPQTQKQTLKSVFEKNPDELHAHSDMLQAFHWPAFA